MSDEFDNPFKRRAEEERRRRKTEAEAKAKAEAEAKAVKAKAKKLANRAVEDDWLFDKPGDKTAAGPESDEDDDRGFQVWVKPDDQPAAAARPSPPSGGIKIKNLIDFEECDQCDEPTQQAAETQGTPPYEAPSLPEFLHDFGPTTAQSPWLDESHTTQQTSLGAAVPATFPPGMSSIDLGPSSNDTFALQMEISSLRQQLSDAQAEKQIHIEILQDEKGEVQKELASTKARLQELRENSASVELDSVRQQLKDAQAETVIQLEITRDEVKEKQRLLDQALQKKAEAEALVQWCRPTQAGMVPEQATRMQELEARVSVFQPDADSRSAENTNDAFVAARRIEELERLLQDRQCGAQASDARAAHLEAEIVAIQQRTVAQVTALEQDAQCSRRQQCEAEVSLQQCQTRILELEAAQKATPSDFEAILPEIQGYLAEVRATCDAGQRVLGMTSAQTFSASADLTSQVREARDAVVLLRDAAQETGEVKHQLSTKNAELVEQMSAATARCRELEMQAASASAARAAEVTLREADKRAQSEELGRHAAQALRDVRINVEKQLAQLTERLNGSHCALGRPMKGRAASESFGA